MSGEPENILLIHLRRLGAEMAALREDMRDVKHRLTSMEGQVGQVLANDQNHYAATMVRIDRIETRLERIERRLDLTEAPA